MTDSINILVIPDIQAKPGVPLVHCDWLSRYAAEKEPDVMVQLGDLWDFPSLSSYDRGTRRAEGKRLDLDQIAGELALDLLLGHAPPSTRKVFTCGNHENRLDRYLDEHPELHGAMGIYVAREIESRGVEFFPFLETVEISGVLFSHFFARGPNGSVMQTKNGAPNAKEQIRREGQSCVAGHKQGLDVAYHQFSDRRAIGVICGSAYVHQEEYLSPQGGAHWNGAVRLCGVTPNGEAELSTVSLDFLCRRYVGVPLREFLRDATDFELMRAPQ